LRIRRAYSIGRMFLKILNILYRKFSPEGKSRQGYQTILLRGMLD
jgi:hypothetical protein